ncbi:MAG: D-2-hydroxyacid dehydrogenase [Eubacteriaceae bacterium]|nr:D-2-hydroxyacid dehydrogenase [Eubacteriaceae bacterium]
MKITVLDGELMNPGDLSWDGLASFGELKVYDRSTPEECAERIKDSDVVLFNAVDMNRELILSGPKLKFLCVTATGYDNLDIETAKERGIACANAPDYSTEAVAQHTIALMLEITNHVGLHEESVRSHMWNEDKGAYYWLSPLSLLSGKSLGIIGYGNIGRKVAKIAEALGMNINIYSRDPEAAVASDFVSLHLPAAENTIGFINKTTLSKMKDGAVLINSARGALIDEKDVAAALKSGKLSAYATDALIQEPPEKDNVLVGLPNCIITPHQAWCPVEARQKLMDICIDDLKSFIAGGTLNRLDL